MKLINLPPIAERENLLETPTEALMELILRQQEIIQRLMEEVKRLKSNASSDGRSSSKPPSSNIYKRSEQSQPEARKEGEAKHKPGLSPVMRTKRAKDLGV